MKYRVLFFVLMLASYSLGNFYAAMGGIFADSRLGMMAIYFPGLYASAGLLFSSAQAYTISRFSQKRCFYHYFWKRAGLFCVLYVSLTLLLYFLFGALFHTLGVSPPLANMLQFYALTILNLWLLMNLIFFIRLKGHLTLGFIVASVLIVVSALFTVGPLAAFNFFFITMPYFVIANHPLQFVLSYFLIFGAIAAFIINARKSDFNLWG